MNYKSKSTELKVCPKEWARITETITASFDLAGLSRIYTARAIDAVASIIYDSRSASQRGHKFLDHCIHLPAEWFQNVFRNKGGVTAKCKKTLEFCGVLLSDESWCAENLNHPEGVWCDAYAIDYRPQGPETFTVWFPSASSLIENAVATLKKVKGELALDKKGRQTLTIDKAGLLAAARRGEIDAEDFASAVAIFKKYPTLDKCRDIGDPEDHRLYTPLSLVANNVLPFIHFADTGESIQEALDIHSSVVVCLTFAAIIEKMKPVYDKDGVLVTMPCDRIFRHVVKSIYEGRWSKIDGKWHKWESKDLYMSIYREITEREPATNLFYGLRKDEIRDRIKEEFMAAVFANKTDVKRWESSARAAMVAMRTGKRVSKGAMYHQRKVRLRLAIREYLKKNYPLMFHFAENYDTVQAVGKKGHIREKKTPLYYAMTRAEEILMTYLQARYERSFGVVAYRKHDALLAAAEPMCEADADNWTFRALLGIVGSDDFDNGDGRCVALAEAFNRKMQTPK